MLPPEQVAGLAAVLLAINPGALKGIVVRGPPSECERWLEQYIMFTPASPLRRIPANIPEERLLGGLDFAATIAQGRPVYESGIFVAANNGSVLLPAATVQKSTWQHVSRALDSGHVAVERDGFSERQHTMFSAIAFETADDEICPAAFVERVAFVVTLASDARANANSEAQANSTRELIALARLQLPEVVCSERALVALCRSADTLGIRSPRTVLLALATARTCAAFHLRSEVSDDDIASAAVLVYAPRATCAENDEDRADDVQSDDADIVSAEQVPAAENVTDTGMSESSHSETREPSSADQQSVEANALSDIVVQAVRSSLPAGLLAAAAAKVAGQPQTSGRVGEKATVGNRGRQTGTRRGDPRGGARLDIVATLRAAVPWQRIRKSARPSTSRSVVELRRDDFRIRKCVTPGTTTTLFVVDASGSSALHRLAEVKGAIELMLAEGYARRDRVAVIAFRGTAAQLVLPPTNALARARRAVSGMPAGGGTPIATALDLAASVVQTLKRDSGQTVVVVLSDGHANVGRDGKGGRAQAEADARDAATRLRAVHDRIVWIDSSVRQHPQSKLLSDALGARYVALPMATATGLSDVARMARA